MTKETIDRHEAFYEIVHVAGMAEVLGHAMKGQLTSGFDWSKEGLEAIDEVLLDMRKRALEAAIALEPELGAEWDREREANCRTWREPVVVTPLRQAAEA